MYFIINLLLLMSSVTSLIVHLMHTWFDFECDVIDVAANQWHDCLRSHMHADVSLFKYMLIEF